MTTDVASSAYITPDVVCAIVPGMTPNHLAQLRYRGTGPRYFKPTPRVVLYREEDVIAWIEASARTSTALREAV